VLSDAEDDGDDDGGSIRWRRSNRWARVIDLPEVLAIIDGRAFLLDAGILSWCSGMVFYRSSRSRAALVPASFCLCLPLLLLPPVPDPAKRRSNLRFTHIGQSGYLFLLPSDACELEVIVTS